MAVPVTVPLREEIRMLSVVDILEPLSEEELGELAVRHPDAYFGTGEIFCTPFDTSERFFIVKKGRVQVYKLGPEGRKVTVAEIGYGTVLCAQLLNGSYAQAIEPTVLLVLNKEDMEQLIESNPAVGIRFIEVLVGRLRMCESRLADVALKEIPGRLASLILQLLESEGVVTREGYAIPVYYTHERLATMIGASRVAVTRAFKKLREREAIELTDRKICVKDVEVLKRVAAEKQQNQNLTS
jgi:CRP/FNR family cyclic AMP-dependent transcriptional regulator